jgi:PAS domain-containing protein
MGDSVELVPPGIPGAEADGVLFAGEFAKRTQDLQLCAQGFLDSVPDALVLVDSENKVVWHNQMLQSMAGSESSLIGLSFLESLGSPELISPAVLPTNMDPGPDKVLKVILKMAERKFVAIRASRSPLPVGDGDVTRGSFRASEGQDTGVFPGHPGLRNHRNQGD